MLHNQHFIPSLHHSPLTIWDFPSFCQPSWRHVDFSTRFFWACPRATQSLHSLELQIPAHWQGLGEQLQWALLHFQSRGWILSSFWQHRSQQTGGKVLPALLSCNVISIHFDFSEAIYLLLYSEVTDCHLFPHVFPFYSANNTLCMSMEFLASQGLEVASWGTSARTMPGTQPFYKSVSYDTLKIQGEEEGFWKWLW